MLPTDNLNSQYEVIISGAIKPLTRSGIVIIGKAKEISNPNEMRKGLLYKSKDAAFPLIVIDDRIIWYGFPLAELYFEDKNYKFLAPKALSSESPKSILTK